MGLKRFYMYIILSHLETLTSFSPFLLGSPLPSSASPVLVFMHVCRRMYECNMETLLKTSLRTCIFYSFHFPRKKSLSNSPWSGYHDIPKYICNAQFILSGSFGKQHLCWLANLSQEIGLEYVNT